MARATGVITSAPKKPLTSPPTSRSPISSINPRCEAAPPVAGKAPSGRRSRWRQRRRRRPRQPWRPRLSRLACSSSSTSSLGRPAGSAPSDDPERKRQADARCRTPDGVAPATISPEASSTVAVHEHAARQERDERRDQRRGPGSTTPCSTASNVSAETAIADRTGTGTVIVWRPRATSDELVPTSTQAGGNRHVAGVGPQDQAEPDRHRHVAEQGDGVAVAGGIALMRSADAAHQPARPRPARPRPRAGRAPRSDQGAARRRASGSTRSSPRRARPNAIISVVGSTTTRGSRTPLAAASGRRCAARLRPSRGAPNAAGRRPRLEAGRCPAGPHRAHNAQARHDHTP